MRILILLIAFVMVTCQQNPQTGKAYEKVAEELQSLNDEYAAAWMNGEVEKCLSMMTPDYVNYLSYHNTQNRQAVEDMFFNMAETNTIANARFDRKELFVHDNMAYEFGYLTQDITPNSGGETQTSRSRYITVFKKHEGEWMFHRWMPQPETAPAQSKEEISGELAGIYDMMAEITLDWDDEKAASIWTDDGLNMPAYGITQNKEELLEFVREIALNNQWEILEYKPLELFVHGDMAYEFSLFEHNATPNSGGETVNTKMRCITVYKFEDGKWKWHRWMPQHYMGE